MAYFSDRPCEIDKATALAYLKEGSALEIGELADKVRRKLHSNRAYYAVNAAITYSNICEVLCPICSFSKREGQEGAYLLTPEEVFERAKKFSEMGAEEIHIIGGIYSKLPLSYYIDIIRAVKSADAKLNIVAFTASECAAMAKASGLPLGEVFERLKAAGVNVDQVARALEVRFVSTNWRGGGVDQPCLEASGMSEVMDGLLEELDQGCRIRLSEISLAELDSRLYLKQRR